MGHHKKKHHLKLAANVRMVYAAVDNGIENARAEAEAANEEKISCTRGCTACCRMQVIITAPEALAITQRHPDLVAARIDDLRQQAEIIRGLAAKHKGDEIAVADEWWTLQLPCPLLLENGDCGVYDVRPIPCRTHFVIDPPEECAKVPTVVIGHWLPDVRDGAYKAITEMWFANFETNQFPIGCLQKMVLLAHNTVKTL